MAAGLHAGIAVPVFWSLTPAEYSLWLETAFPDAPDGGLADDPAALKALMENGFEE